MAATSAPTRSLPADVSGRRHSIDVLRHYLVDDSRSPAVHQFKRQSSSSSYLQIASDIEPLSAGSSKDIDGPASAEILVRLLEHGNNDADNEFTVNTEITSSRCQMEATELRATKTGTDVPVLDTAIDRSGSDEEDEQRLATSANLRYAIWHTHSAVSRLPCSLYTKDFGTQTVQEQWTQTNAERSTQTDELHDRGGIAEDLRCTRLQQDGQYRECADTGYSYGVQRDLLHDVYDDRVSTLMVDFAQQTTTTRWTQTPVKLRLGTDGRLTNVADGVPLMHTAFSRAAADPRVLTGFVDREVVPDNEFDVVQSRDFGTQTFDKFTTRLVPTSQAQTSVRKHHICSGRKSNVVVKDRVKGSKPKDRNSERHENKSVSVLQESDNITPIYAQNCSSSRHDGMMSVMNEYGHYHHHGHHHSKHKNEIDNEGYNKTDRLKHHKYRCGCGVNSDRCSPCSSRHDASRMDLLKLMLHQIKDLKDKASSVVEDADESNARKRSKDKQ